MASNCQSGQHGYRKRNNNIQRANKCRVCKVMIQTWRREDGAFPITLIYIYRNMSGICMYLNICKYTLYLHVSMCNNDVNVWIIWAIKNKTNFLSLLYNLPKLFYKINLKTTFEIIPCLRKDTFSSCTYTVTVIWLSFP